MKKDLADEGDFDVFYSPSSVPLEDGLEDIKEVDELEINMAEEEEEFIKENEFDVNEVSRSIIKSLISTVKRPSYVL